MKAVLWDEPFSDPGWIFERKLDGIRGIAGLPEQQADLGLACPSCETPMELAAKDLARCPKCGLQSVKVEGGA